jgi:hypothetical protein
LGEVVRLHHPVRVAISYLTGAHLDSAKSVCGMVMPISAIEDCTESHWLEVRSIFVEAIESAGMVPRLVSDSDDVGIIHKRIVQNLYDNPIVVCDISARNPNVMFELGLRLAFDKPTVIVKDHRTPYSFDTSVVEHLEYPRDLRFSRIVDFKERLTQKLLATDQKAKTDPSYSTFLKNFGEFKVAQIEQREVSGQELILEELQSLRKSIRQLSREPITLDHEDRLFPDGETDIELLQMSERQRSGAILISISGMTDIERVRMNDFLSQHPQISRFSVNAKNMEIIATPTSRADKSSLLMVLAKQFPGLTMRLNP